MNSVPVKPVYFIPKDHPLIAKYHSWFEAFRKDPRQQLRIVIDHDTLKNNFVAEVLHLFLASQHHPDLLEHLIFALEFAFEKPGKSKERYEGHEWKNEKAMKWLFELGIVFPPAVFFLNDNDARLFSLIGDLISVREIITLPLKPNMGRLYIGTEQIQILHERLFNSACFFALFCHGSSFNPQKYVESLVADFKLDFTYDNIEKTYLERMKHEP